ncbi:hypothetical protein [Cupriavidus sp. a3]|uniref:hypothetical protein n=1 Tax=Cupriavidus sp. a3 TaxID=3242158 RepID=UPI003D9C5201
MDVTENGLIKTIGEIGLERLEECSTWAGQRFLPSVRTCFWSDVRGRAEAFGTCFLMRVQGKPFLVTAGHVIDKNEGGQRTIYVASGNRLSPLQATFYTTAGPDGQRGKDHYDFAFAELSDFQCKELAADSFIDETMVSANQAAPERRAYMTLGFPASKQKVAWDKPIAYTEPWTFVGFHKHKPELATKLEVSGEHHFFVDRDERVRNFKGERQNAVKPHGTSGGILIDLGPFDFAKLEPGSQCTALLAGLIIEHHKEHRAIVAVRIQLVIEQMLMAISSRA